jgi:hypothetical protein
MSGATSLCSQSIVGCLFNGMSSYSIRTNNDRSPNLLVENCTFYNVGTNGIEFTGAAEAMTVNNCIFANCGNYGIANVQNTMIISNNLFYNNTSGNIEEIGSVSYILENNTTGSDPLFTDPANGDFTLQPGSPAIGTGSRGQDIGYHQSSGGGGGGPITIAYFG